MKYDTTITDIKIPFHRLVVIGLKAGVAFSVGFIVLSFIYGLFNALLWLALSN